MLKQYFTLFNFIFFVLLVNIAMAQYLEQKLFQLNRNKRYLTYTYNSAIGMFLAFAVPVEIPNRDILFSYNFEANYNLPTNISMYDLSPPTRRLPRLFAFNRTYIYNILEERIDNFIGSGSPGRQCIMRLICDVAKTPLYHNGLLGRILHILFTPSTSLNEGLKKEEEAEKLGLRGIDCSKRYKQCPHSVIDAISFLE